MPLRVGVIAADDTSMRALADELTDKGWSVDARSIVADDATQVTAQLMTWIASDTLDLVVTHATTSARSAVKPLVTRRLIGFSDLANVDGGRCQNTVVLLVPRDRVARVTALDTALPRVERELVAKGVTTAGLPTVSIPEIKPGPAGAAVRPPPAPTAPPARPPVAGASSRANVAAIPSVARPGAKPVIPVGSKTPPIPFAKVPARAPGQIDLAGLAQLEELEPEDATSEAETSEPSSRAGKPPPQQPGATNGAPGAVAGPMSAARSGSTNLAAAKSAPMGVPRSSSATGWGSSGVVASAAPESKSAPMREASSSASASWGFSGVVASVAPPSKSAATSAVPPLARLKSDPAIGVPSGDRTVAKSASSTIASSSEAAAAPSSNQPPIVTSAAPIAVDAPSGRSKSNVVSSDQSASVHSHDAIDVPTDARARARTEPSIVVEEDAAALRLSDPALLVSEVPADRAKAAPPPPPPKGPPALFAFDSLATTSPPAPVFPAASEAKSSRGLWLALIAFVAIGGGAAYLLLGGDSKPTQPVASNHKPVDPPIVENSSDTPITDPPATDGSGEDVEIDTDEPGTETGVSGTTRPTRTRPTGTGKRPSGTATTSTTGTTRPGGTTSSADVSSTGTTRPGGTTSSATGSTGTTTSSTGSTGTTTSSTGSTGTTRPGGTTSSGVSGAGPVSADGCDKVSCVIDNFGRACCEAFRPRKAGDVPYTLDKSMIVAGMGKAKAAVIRCGEQSRAKGIVKVAVVVTGNGSVGSVTVDEAPDAALGTCVASAVRKVTFASTATGGTFSYPFKF